MRVPLAVGLKLSVKVQLAPAASDVVQVLALILKALAFVPVSRYEFTVTVVVPVLVIVMDCDAAVVPTAVAGNVMLCGEKVSLLATAPMPDSETI
jgi:hypothetical protein